MPTHHATQTGCDLGSAELREVALKGAYAATDTAEGIAHILCPTELFVKNEEGTRNAPPRKIGSRAVAGAQFY